MIISISVKAENAQHSVQRTWWWAVQNGGVQAKAFVRFVGWFSHQAANASRWAATHRALCLVFSGAPSKLVVCRIYQQVSACTLGISGGLNERTVSAN